MAKKSKSLPLYKIIQSQGFGTRAYCRALIAAGDVTAHSKVCENPDELFELEELELSIEGQVWKYAEFVYIMLNKPAGFECSQKPKYHKSVLTLLPVHLRERDVQCVGRLDVDTTGLLLLSDDGQFIHKNTSPKKNVNKVYHATCAQSISEEFLQRLKTGVLLHDEQEAISAINARALDDKTLELTLKEGKYHQVKRMVTAAGNHVEQLHRLSVGDFVLPNNLAQGDWMLLDVS